MKFRLKHASILAILLAVTTPIVVWVLLYGLDSFWMLRSESSIEGALERTLNVSQMPAVFDYLRDNGCRVVSSSTERGLMSRHGGKLGSQHIRAHLGEYALGFLVKAIYANFAFDDQGRLVAIEVKKVTDGP